MEGAEPDPLRPLQLFLRALDYLGEGQEELYISHRRYGVWTLPSPALSILYVICSPSGTPPVGRF